MFPHLYDGDFDRFASKSFLTKSKYKQTGKLAESFIQSFKLTKAGEQKKAISVLSDPALKAKMQYKSWVALSAVFEFHLG